jgi:hypothetical protein
MGENRNTYAFWGENLKDTDHLKKLSEDGKIVLKSILIRTAGLVGVGVGVDDWTDSARVRTLV